MILVHGVLAMQKVEERFRPSGRRSLGQLPDGSISLGHWQVASQPEEVVITKINQKHVEICGHGGNIASKRILDDLRQSGCKEIPWQTYLDSIQEHPFEGETLRCLARCPSRHTAELVLAQFNGALAQGISEILVELQTGRSMIARNQLDSLIQRSNAGKHFSEPWRVVVAGPPNAGKSSLINAMAGFDRSIVSARPGTTRDVLKASVVIHGWPFELCDTAGLRIVDEPLEAAGIKLAREEMSGADLILMVEEAIEDKPFDYRGWSDVLVPVIPVLNKSDLLKAVTPSNSHVYFTSAKTGAGLKTLLKAVVSHLIPESISASTGLLFAERHFLLAHQASHAIAVGRFEEAYRLLARIAPLAKSRSLKTI